MTTIAIVGAGFSGTLLSLHLLRHCPPPTRLVLIERNSQFGRGLAYSSGNPSHILNVPAGRMSAFHDKPHDFLRWLTRQQETECPPAPAGAETFTPAGAETFTPAGAGTFTPAGAETFTPAGAGTFTPAGAETFTPAGAGTFAPSGAGTFAPRRQFGAYIRALLNDEIKRSGRERLELVKGNVTNLDRTAQTLVLTLDRDRTMQADIVVLATGNFPPAPVPVANTAFYDSPAYRPDPWAQDALTDLDPDAPLLLLGTGLTTMDAVISLLDQEHRGPIYALSRRGLLPRRHEAVPMPAPEHEPYPTSVNALTRFLRNETARAVAEGSGWQPVIDELRPFTVDVWQAMKLNDRKRFLRHLRPWWEVHRHRMAAQVADRIDAARASGQLRVIVGRVRDYTIHSDHVEVLYRPRHQNEPRTIQVARVINCAGPGADYDRIPDPLIRGLLRSGVVRPDPLRLGLDVTGNCALLNKDGAISRRLFAVGPVTKGTFWEMTAVPDIRRQTEKLAEYLAGLTKAAPPQPVR